MKSVLVMDNVSFYSLKSVKQGPLNFRFQLALCLGMVT